MVRSMLYRFTERAMYLSTLTGAAPWSPNRRKIGDLLEALSRDLHSVGRFDQPAWLDKRTTGISSQRGERAA